MATMPVVDGRYQLEVGEGVSYTLDMKNKIADKDVKLIGVGHTQYYKHIITAGSSNYWNAGGLQWRFVIELYTADSTAYTTAADIVDAISRNYSGASLARIALYNGVMSGGGSSTTYPVLYLQKPSSSTNVLDVYYLSGWSSTTFNKPSSGISTTLTYNDHVIAI